MLSGKSPKSALRPAGGPISVFSREQYGHHPARKLKLKPRSPYFRNIKDWVTDERNNDAYNKGHAPMSLVADWGG